MINKLELNLQSEQDSKLVFNIVEKSLAGITRKEIIELREVCEQDKFDYYNKLKLKYIVPLGLLGLDYKITLEIEETIFLLIHDFFHKVSVTGNLDNELEIQIS